MRKYAIPKAVYLTLVLILLCLSFGSTYAYFSAIATAESTVELGQIAIEWVDSNRGDTLKYFYDNPDTDDINEAKSIALTGKLQRGGYTLLEVADSDAPIKLQMSNSGTVSSYCRIKITATYDPKENGEQVSNPQTCNSSWFKLALTVGTEKVFITDLSAKGYNGWFYNEADGYYYYGTKTTSGQTETITLTELDAGGGQIVADYIYLDSSADAVILGSSVNIILTLEGIQTTNNACKAEWGI